MKRFYEDCVVYDIEVKRGPDEVKGGWENPQAMGFASGVVYDYTTDSYYFYLHAGNRRILLKNLHQKLVISFNGIAFDSRVLMGNSRILKNSKVISDADRTPRQEDIYFYNYDILLEYVRARFGYRTVAEAEEKLGDESIHDGTFCLAGLAEGTLNMRKTGHGSQAPELYRQRKYAELFDHNLQDVRLTKKLFDHIMQHGYVIDRARRKVQLLEVKNGSGIRDIVGS